MKKLVLTTAAVLFTGYFATRLYLEVHTQIIVDRFPDLPEEEVRKAHAEMFKRGLRGELDGVETEEEMDAYLRQLVKEQTAQ
jgi:hypothetical protein